MLFYVIYGLVDALINITGINITGINITGINITGHHIHNQLRVARLLIGG